jgi:DNA-binding NtrC family response regulator
MKNDANSLRHAEATAWNTNLDFADSPQQMSAPANDWPGGATADPTDAVAEDRSRKHFTRAKRIAIADFERNYFEDLRQQTNGNIAEMARRSGMERHHVRGFLKKYGLHRSASDGAR